MGMFDFMAGAAPDDPRSAMAMDMRRKIAMAMIQRDRKGYPKNLGEGLSAIGDAIGERGSVNAAMRQMSAYEDYVRANPRPSIESLTGEKSDVKPTGATSDASPVLPAPMTAVASAGRPPVKAMGGDDADTADTADTTPVLPAPSMDTAQAVMAAPSAAYFATPSTAQASAPPPSLAPTSGPMNPVQASQMAQLTGPPPAAAASSFAPTAALNSPPVQSDAVPPPGASLNPAVRNSIAQTLGARGALPAQGVPQPNPTLGAGSVPPVTASTYPELAALGAGSPDRAATNRQIDFPMSNTQVAQAGPPPSVPPNRYSKPMEMPPSTPLPYPKDAPKNGAEIYGERLKQQGIDLEDNRMKEQGELYIQKGKELRDKADADAKTQWDKQNQLRQEFNLKQQFEGSPSGQQQLIKAQAEAADAQRANRFGGQAGYQQFVGDMSKSYDATQQLANSMPFYQQAKQTLAQAYTGKGAELKLDANKMLRALGVPGDYTPVVATEMLRSRMKAIAGGLIKSTVGSTNISNTDRDFVEEAYSGKISVEPESLRRLLNAAEETTIRALNRHNDRLIGVAKNPDDSVVRDQYLVPMPYGDAATGYLKAHPETADLFDKKFGKGHAKAVLQGTSYGQ